MSTQIEFTDRYDALGIKPPSLLTMCRGQCEATGMIPVFLAEGAAYVEDATRVRLPDETDPELIARWRAAEERDPADDGWHFVRCPACEGTGRTRGFGPRLRQVGFWASKKWDFARRHVIARPYTAGTAAHVLAMQQRAPSSAFEVGGEEPPWQGLTAYADRLDVPHPWWWNRRIALRVLLGRGGRR